VNKEIKNILKDLLPSIIVRTVKKSRQSEWRGDYKNFSTAQQNSQGYHVESILEKVKDATLKVKNGEAVYERDSVLFDTIEYSWPLLSSLMWVAAINKGALKVLDFGGSLGSTYFQNKKFLDTMDSVQWNIVEQKSFVECGRQFIQDHQLNFFNSIQAVIKEKGLPDILLVACTLPYVDQPYFLLNELMHYRIPYLVLDNTPFNYASRDRLTIQTVHPSIYKASYPCWLLNYEKIVETVEGNYTIITEHFNDSSIYVDGRKIQYRGFLAKKRDLA
jgi:putative methyltransferase (TIGR04325 family)